MKIFISLFGAAQVFAAGYSNLIPLGDGSGVYFQAASGFTTATWHLYRNGQVQAVDPPNTLADVSDSGSVVATQNFQTKICTSGGSSCFLQPNCVASYGVRGPGINLSGDFRQTFIRLSRSGKIAWIDQTGDCSGLGTPKAPPLLRGLYESTALGQISDSFAMKLANQRYGRRLITDSGRALTLAGSDLWWLDWTGARQVHNAAGAYEAVTDRLGNNIAYVEATGRLHWIASSDEDLGLDGSAPAMSDDGRTLVFLGIDGSMEVYDRASGQARKIGVDNYSEFAFDGGVVWAVNTAAELVQIDLTDSKPAVALKPVLDIESADTPDVPLFLICFYCYGLPDPQPWISTTMIVSLHGHNLSQTGWRVRAGDSDTALNPVNETEAYFQVPENFPAKSTPVEIYNPDHPLKFSMTAQLLASAATCVGTLHQDGVRLVTKDAPAAPGEVVTVYLTGLHGVEPIPDGVPNPIDHLVPLADAPPLYDPGSGDILFFGLAPGLVGIEQLNLRVLRPAAANQLLLVNGFGCSFPPMTN